MSKDIRVATPICHGIEGQERFLKFWEQVLKGGIVSICPAFKISGGGFGR